MESNENSGVSTISLYYSTDGGDTYSLIQTQVITLNAYQSVEIPFLWTPEEEGVYELKTVVTSPEDTNPDNDLPRE